MQILLNLKPEDKKGIYAVSKPVQRYSQIASTLPEFTTFVNKGEWGFDNRLAYALSHCQVNEEPYAFFVLNPELVGNKKSKRGTRDTYKNFFFPSQVIINPRIVEMPKDIEANVPKRDISKDAEGKVVQKITIKKEMTTNKIQIAEACMSFPYKKQKLVDRYYKIKVKYQVARQLFGISFLITKTEWCEGLKAHIFQHECQHLKGENMYYFTHPVGYKAA